MTTTDFIKLLTEYEFGGATGRPREVMFEVDDEIFETDGVEVTGSGDGLFTELYLSLPSAKRKTGKWIRHPLYKQKEFREWDVCTACGTGCRRREYGENPDGTEYETIYGYRYCPNCNAKMEAKE